MRSFVPLFRDEHPIPEPFSRTRRIAAPRTCSHPCEQRRTGNPLKQEPARQFTEQSGMILRGQNPKSLPRSATTSAGTAPRAQPCPPAPWLTSRTTMSVSNSRPPGRRTRPISPKARSGVYDRERTHSQTMPSMQASRNGRPSSVPARSGTPDNRLSAS